MKMRAHFWALALALSFAASCASAPESGKQEQPKGPQFDADYYALNAKKYFNSGRYGQAKDQWQKQLVKDPDNWMARLGIAYSDLHLAEQAASTNRDFTSARTLATSAESGFRALYAGQVEADTLAVDPKRPQWKAALGLALATRTQGYLDQLESQRAEAGARGGGVNAGTAANRAAELQLNRDRRYQDAIGIFNLLAYMKHASPEAIKQLADLYVVTKQDALAEQEFKRYLSLAGSTRSQLEQGRKQAGTTYADKQELAESLFDEKLASNAEKQVTVMADMATLAWSRGDYAEARTLFEDSIKLDPNRRDLYLRLAECEHKLDMLETALEHVNEYLKRSSSKRSEFDDDIRAAMKLKQEIEQKLRARPK